MRLNYWVWIAALVSALTCWGCTGSAQRALSKSQTILALAPAKGFVKKVAMVQTPLPKAAFDRKAGDLFYKALTAAIREERAELQLLVSEENGADDILAPLSHATGPINAAALSQEGRRKGYHGLITTALHGVQAETYNSGLFWFRKTRYRFTVELTLDLYDPFTGAKLLNLLEEGSVKVSVGVYNDYKSGQSHISEKLSHTLISLAEDMADQVVETLEAQPWLVSVAQVAGARIYLAAGRQAGLRAGQRLAVVNGQQVLKGAQGESFVLPGQKIDEIVITQVDHQSAEAKTDSPGKIKAGDIAIPVR